MVDDEQDPRLSGRARRLWDELVTDTTPEDVRALVLEACRAAERCDRLNWACKRDGIIELVENSDFDDSTQLQIEVGSAMAEARQQGQALKNLLIEIEKRQAKTAGPAPDDDVLNGL